MNEIIKSELEVRKTKTLVSFTMAATDAFPARTRYLEAPGYKVYKGQYRNRRLAQVVRSTWNDDRAKAFAFDSPGAARKLLAYEFGAARVRNYKLEPVKMRSLDHAITFASGRTRHSFDAWQEI